MAVYPSKKTPFPGLGPEIGDGRLLQGGPIPQTYSTSNPFYFLLCNVKQLCNYSVWSGVTVTIAMTWRKSLFCNAVANRFVVLQDYLQDFLGPDLVQTYAMRLVHLCKLEHAT